MHLLIVAATAREIDPFIKTLHKDAQSFAGQQIDILITGIGLAAATHALTRQIMLRPPSIVIQAGIAGGFDKRIPLGTVVLVEQDCFADMGVVEKRNFKSVFDIKLQALNTSPFTNGFLMNKTSIPAASTLLQVKGISVNEITTSLKRIEYYTHQCFASVESMEGAALHYVCLKENIPFLQLRSISNYVGERNKDKWKIKEAIDSLNIELTNLLEAL